MKPGTKPQLTEELSAKIRTLYLGGNNYITIQEILEIKPTTWDSWVYKNYKDFRVQLQNYKHERLVRKAETNVGVLLGSEDERVQLDMTKFTLKTLGKDQGYSERTELTGENGAPLNILFDKSFDNEK